MSEPKRILCVGLCYLDYVHVCNKGLQEGSIVKYPKGHYQRGGNASNVSTVISLLGGNVEFLGVLSNSKGFEVLADDLKEKNIHIEHCPRIDLDPGFSSIFLDLSTNSRSILTNLSKNFRYPTLDEFKAINLENYSMIHWEGKFIKETIKMMQHVYDYNQKNENNKIIMSVEFDFIGNDAYYVGPDIMHLTDLTDVVMLSKSFSQSHGWTNMKEAAYNLRESITHKEILIICFWNEQGTGMLYNNVFELVDPYKSDVLKDPVGYTDSFVAGTIYSMSLGTDPRDAIDFGNKVAAYKIQNYGFNHIAQLST